MNSTRSQISQAARAIFEHEGVEGISMRRIASEVGITATAIYRHFADKDALVAAVVDEGFAILETYLRRATREQAGIDGITRLLEAYIDFALKYPRYYDQMFLVPRSDVRRFPEDFERRDSVTFNVLLDLVADAIDSGELADDDPLEVSLTIWSQTHGLVALYRCGRFGSHPSRFRAASRRATERLLNGLTP